MEEIKRKINDEIVSGFNTLGTMSVDDDKYADACDNVVKLCEIRLKIKKADDELEEKRERREIDDHQHELENQTKMDQIYADETYRKAELEDKKVERNWQKIAFWVGTATSLAIVGVNVLHDFKLFSEGLRFEETGTYIGSTFKMMIPNIFRKK